MSDTPAPIPSLADRVRRIDAGAPVVGVHFLGKRAGVRARRGGAAVCARDGEQRRVAIHAGGILASASRRQAHRHRRRRRQSHRHRRRRRPHRLATDAKKRWIDQIALGSDGAVAWSAGKVAHVLTKKGEARCSEAPSTVAGLAFAPKGFRLAIAHYNGVTLWFPNAAATPEKLEWKGSHLSVAFSPDGKFVVTAMQEPTLHGWRLAGRPAHAHVGLFGARALARLDGGRQIPRHVGLRTAHPLAVRRQGRAHGQAADDRWPAQPRAFRSSPAIRASRWSRSGLPTAARCWCASTTAP